MNPALLLSVSGVTKRQVLFVLVTMVVIASLPVAAVFAMGDKAVSYLFSSPASSDSTNAVSTTTEGLYEGPEIAGDAYDWGNCTYWVYALRLKAGDPIPAHWGNANSWALNAALAGYRVDHSPEPNAIMQTSGGSLGHVAYVTAVDAVTGAWTISEMNVVGLNIIDVRTYPATAALNFSFIHDKLGKGGL